MPPQDFPGMQVPVPSSSPFSFSVGRPAAPPQLSHFTTTTQFQTKTEPGQLNITSESPINLGLNNEAKKELHDSPTAQPHQQQAGNVQEDVQKIQENNNNNQSEGESNSEEVTPPKNQGLIKVNNEQLGCFHPHGRPLSPPSQVHIQMIILLQARGTYFPLTAFPTNMPQGSVMRRDSTPPTNERSLFGEY